MTVGYLTMFAMCHPAGIGVNGNLYLGRKIGCKCFPEVFTSLMPFGKIVVKG